MILTEANWTEDQIVKWLKSEKISNYRINLDKTVSVDGTVNLFNHNLNNLPIKFDKVNGDFLVRHNLFANFKGFPNEIGGDLSVSHNKNLKSFSGASGIIVRGKVYMAETGIRSLEGVSDIFAGIYGNGVNFSLTQFESDIKTGGMGLVLIDGVSIGNGQYMSSIAEPAKIITKYLGRPGDVFECQAELIEAGFERFATL